jgi:transposase/predicted site-specific integrase-resolvase
VRELTAKERGELARLVRGGTDASAVRRAQMVLLSSRGKAAAEIAPLWGVTSQCVRKVLNRFDREGPAGLPDRPRCGRPRKADGRYVEPLKEAVRAGPHTLGYAFGCRTPGRLREHLALRTRVVLSPAHLSRLMAENRIVYRRPRHGMTHLRDPKEYDEKKAFPAFVKKKAAGPGAGFDLLYPGECEVHLHPTLTKVWTPRGVRPVVPAAGERNRMKSGAQNNQRHDAIYVRSASTVQKGDTGIDEQLARCREQVDPDPLEYVEVGGAGSRPTQKPQFERLKRDVATGKIKRLFVLSYDRLGRGHQALAYLESFKAQGCEVVSVSEGPCSIV